MSALVNNLSDGLQAASAPEALLGPGTSSFLGLALWFTLQAERALSAMAEISLTFPDGSSEIFKERRILGRGSPQALGDSGLSKEQCQLELVEGLEQEFVISVTNLGKNCELNGLQPFLPLCRISTVHPCSAYHRAPAS